MELENKEYCNGKLVIPTPKGITVLCIMCIRRPAEDGDLQCKECNEEERKYRESKK